MLAQIYWREILLAGPFAPMLCYELLLLFMNAICY